MARLDPNRHDHLEQTPVVKKTVVDTVLDGVISAGNSIVSLLAGLLATVLIIYSGYVIVDTVDIQERAKSASWDLLQYKPEYIDDDNAVLSGTALEEVNSDYRGWITLYDTNIDYPVMQGQNDLYYSSHDIYGRTSLTGSIYLAARNLSDFSDSYNLIYGHHMDGGIMFGSLDQYRDYSFFESHRTGVLVTKSGVYDITLFAAAKTDAYERKLYEVSNGAAGVLSFLDDPSVSVGIGTEVLYYEQPLDPNKIIALSTCADADTNGRFIIFGSMVKRNLITLEAGEYIALYDGNSHTFPISTNYPDDTVFEYSLDGGITWTTEKPYRTYPCEEHIRIRATNPVYGTAEAEGYIKIMETVDPSIKILWEDEGNEKRPSSIVTILTNGENIWTATLNEGNDWYTKFPYLPKYDEDGNEYSYTWAIPDVMDYTLGHNVKIGYDTILSYIRNKDNVDDREFTLTIYYRFVDGTEAAGTYSASVRVGSSFYVPSPNIAGYTPSSSVVSGIGAARNMVFTVVYITGSTGTFIPVTGPQTIDLDDYNIPLGIGEVYIQKGYCIE